MADLHPPPPETTNGAILIDSQPPLINNEPLLLPTEPSTKRNRRPSVRLTSIGTTTPTTKRNKWQHPKFRHNNPSKRVRSNWGAIGSKTLTTPEADGVGTDDDQNNNNFSDEDEDGLGLALEGGQVNDDEENMEGLEGVMGGGVKRRSGVRTRGVGLGGGGEERLKTTRTGVRTRGLVVKRRENDEVMEMEGVEGEEIPVGEDGVHKLGRGTKRTSMRTGLRTRGLGIHRTEIDNDNDNDGFEGGDGGGKRRTGVRTRGLGAERREDEEEDGNEAEEEEEDEDEEEEKGRRDWRCRSLEDGIQMWLNGLGLSRYAPVFEIHEVDEEVLPMLTLDDLKDMGINAVGSKRKLYSAIQKLAKGFS